MPDLASPNGSPAAFSHAEYREILARIGPDLKDYLDVTEAAPFVILRHDVEFSVTRAHRMAQIEQQAGARATYFFQVSSCAYNPFSIHNRALITDIGKMGHQVGLHLYVSHIAPGDWAGLQTELQQQKQLFETGLNLPCTRFSYHRPPAWVLENRDDVIFDLLCAYGASFFEYSPTPQRIRYLADSKHRWSYGHPLDTIAQDKIQILVHPDEWTAQGGDEPQYFSDLIAEHRVEFMDTVDRETQHFKNYREDLA